MNCSERVLVVLTPAKAGRRLRAEDRIAKPFALIAVLVISAGCAASAQAAPPWHYDLRPGDHLTYRFTFERRTQDQEEQSHVKVTFTTHVLVAGENSGRISLGFQRNRESAELIEYRSQGKDRLAREQVTFNQRMQKRPSHFSEAMEISPAGEPRYPWEMARETSSHLLDAFREIVTLPPMPLTAGATWRDSSVLELDLRWVGDETIHGKLCHHIEGTLPDKSLKLNYWWSPESGVLEQATLDGSYSGRGDETHEVARMDLESRKRGEQIENWLASPETRLGALQALLLSPQVPISIGQLLPVLNSPISNSTDAASQALALSIALAIASQRSVLVPPDTLNQLKLSASALNQTQIETQFETLVRLQMESSSHAGTAQSPVDECHRPLPSKPPPAKFGTIFGLAAANKESPKIPYLLRIPLTYHGDRPAPLLVYLSGGAGFAIDGVNSAQDVVSGTDYLVLYPQAADYWWKSEVARRFDVVLNEVLQRYNVDPDRIYLTGFSNGGTGALYFATLWPQRFAAVVSLMGAGQCNDQVKAGLPNLGNLPILLVHGADDPLISPDCSTTTHAALTDLHPAIRPELKILPKRGHDLTLQSDDGLTLAFFKDKLRNPFPREVVLAESDALADRAYWIEILAGKPGKSGLDARVKSDNTIEVHSHDVRSIRLHLRPELLPKPGDFRVVWNGRKMPNAPLRDLCSLQALPQTTDPKLYQTDTRDLTLP